MNQAFTGERYVPGVGGVIEIEHLHRYFLASVIAAGLDVLDVASGEGYGSHLLSGVARSVVGIDIADDAVVHAREKYQSTNLCYLQGDCTNLPVKTASVDLVVSFETIEHHDQHELMLREIRRVLRPGGVLLISSPNRPEYDKTLSEPNPYHVKELDFIELEHLLRAHFDNTAFYAQRVLFGSVLVPYQHEEAGFMSFSGSGVKEWHKELNRPIYFVALASDGVLPALGVSAYEKHSISLRQEDMFIKLFLDFGNGFSKETVLVLPFVQIPDVHKFTFDLMGTTGLCGFRLEPLNDSCVIVIEEIAVIKEGNKINLVPYIQANTCSHHGNSYFFASRNPQIDFANVGKGTFENATRFLFSAQYPHIARDATEACLMQLSADNNNHIIELDQKITDLQRETPKFGATRLPVVVSGHIQELADLFKMVIDRKNTAIAAQQSEIDSLQTQQRGLHEWLIRAEAQLDLLKEFALHETGNRLELL